MERIIPSSAQVDRPKKSFFGRVFRFFAYTGLVGFCFAFIVILFGFFKYGRDLPDHKQLRNYTPPVVTRLHAGDGRILAEYAQEKRVFVPIDAIPPLVIHAFLAAEDQQFYRHGGVNFLSIARAGFGNLVKKLEGGNRRPQGASTITQQVAKNFLLTNEVSIERKIKEAILAFRIESVFTKPQILELYLNEIYLGEGSYGVAAAALNYFNKSLDELLPTEAAYLAALPKAPNNYNPKRAYKEAVERRNWVLREMYGQNFITFEQFQVAQTTPLRVVKRDATDYVTAEYFAEEVRRWLGQRYGEKELYGGGYSVRTTLDPFLQKIGESVFRKGLIDYDQKRGWRGALNTINPSDPAALQALAATPNPNKNLGWKLAVVMRAEGNSATLLTQEGQEGFLDAKSVAWTKSKTVSSVLKRGDVVFVTLRQDKNLTKPLYDLQQVPLVSGGLIALDPHTGRVLAMVGGFNYEGSEFNRATQAKRQPGSTFKPFIYLAGLENGYQPNSIILDAPISIYLGAGLGVWRPSNYKDEFYGPTTMRVGLEKSRNSMTVRIAQAIGMKPIQDVVRRFGIMENMPARYSAVLGALEVNLLQMTSAYAVFVNGGKKITPTLIDRIQDRTGKNILKHDTRACPQCTSVGWNNQEMPQIPDNREQITDAGSAYQMVSMLQGVVRAGTGSSIGKALPDAPLAGKTGTTNDNKDVWFVGFSPDLVVGLYMGFDNPRSLGKKITGGSNAAPVFRDFMELALKDNPPSPFRVPPDIRLMRVSHKTGRPASYGEKDVLFEAFKKQKLQEPQKEILSEQPVSEENFDTNASTNENFPMGSDESFAPKDANILNDIY